MLQLSAFSPTPSPSFQNIQGLSETLTSRTCSWKRPNPTLSHCPRGLEMGKQLGPVSHGGLSPVSLTLQVGS